jgi:hypothetical protein
MERFLLSPQRIAFLLAVLGIGASLDFAQTTFEKTYSGYAGYSVQETLDWGYIICGSIAADDGPSDIYLVKTDSQGDTLWTRSYGGPGNDYGSSVQGTSDGGYIIAGIFSYDPGPAQGAVYLVKTNSTGDTLWTKSYGGTWNPPSVQQTSDDGYIITGYTAHIQTGYASSYLLRTSSTGEMLWEKRYTVPPGQVESFTHAYSVRQTSEGGYIIAGDCWSSVFLLKTDSSGDILWTKGYFGYHDEAHSVRQTFDKGYIVVGNTGGSSGGDIFLGRTNPRGDTLWTRTYSSSRYDYGYSVEQTSDGGYVIVGSTSSFYSYEGKGDVCLIKTNSSGDTLWTRTYGGSLGDNGFSVQQTSDGGYVIAGSTASFSADSSSRMYLIKTDANGRVTSEANVASLFSPRIDISTGSYPWSTAAADFDGDGKVDLAATVTDENVVALFRNLGSAGSLSSGSFADRVTFPTGQGPTGIASGDFDSDGKLDLAISNALSNTVSILGNTSTPGTLQFVARMDISVGKDPKGLAAGDLDGDGKQDLVVPNERDSSVSILRNSGSPGIIAFSPLPAITVGHGPLKAIVADLDGDGLADIAVANNVSGSISLLRNVSTADMMSFASPVVLGTGSAPGRMALADIDGDGAPDLIVDNINDGTISLYRNISTSGWLSFSPPVQIPAGNKPWCVAVGDINGDGKADVAVANYQDSTVTIFINRSNVGSIAPDSMRNIGTLRTGVNPLNVEVSDLDGDGNPDLMVACRAANTLSLFQNVSGAVVIPAPVALVAPPDNAVVGNDSVQFSWRPASAGVERYRWEVATDSLFTNPVVDTMLTATSSIIRGLIGGQVYWWRVAAENARSWGPFSPSNRFITLVTGINRTRDFPYESSLSQNFPNPFNPSTTIRYTVAGIGSQGPGINVKLIVYDVLGEVVATLVNETEMPGEFEVTFDASGLSSGVYIYRLQAEGYVHSRKLLLLK